MLIPYMALSLPAERMEFFTSSKEIAYIPSAVADKSVVPISILSNQSIPATSRFNAVILLVCIVPVPNLAAAFLFST